MSNETLETLNSQTLIGFTEKRGNAWHYRADLQDAEGNHYPQAVPLDDVMRRLFAWQALSGPLTSMITVNDERIPVCDETRQVIVRSDTAQVLGVFKAGYKIHQFDQWLLHNVANLLDDGLSIGSAGVLKRGALGWVSVEMPDSITTSEGVEFRPNLLATTSHDGSLATTYKRVVTNVVCDNTHALALSEDGQQFKVKHSVKSLAKIGAARDALAIVHTIGEDFAAEVKALCEVQVSPKVWSAFLDLHAPLPEDAGRSLTMAETQRETLTSLYKADPRVAPWNGTAWGVVQAVNTYVHHVSTVRGATRGERNLERALDGIDGLDAGTLRTLNKALATV